MKSNNPDGRPNVLVDPVRITITIEQSTLDYIDGLGTKFKHKYSRSEVVRSLIKSMIALRGDAVAP